MLDNCILHAWYHVGTLEGSLYRYLQQLLLKPTEKEGPLKKISNLTLTKIAENTIKMNYNHINKGGID